MTTALVVSHLSAFYGASQILHDVSLTVAPGQVVCLLGLNGMGKTTTLRSIMGLVDHSEGEILLDSQPLVGPTYRRSRMGVTLVPEDRRVFPNMTVWENMAVATRSPGGSSGFTFDDATQLFPRLKERSEQKAGTLSGGEQQMLVVARALLSNPRYLLLDEPTEGLAPSYVEAIRDSIEAARRNGIGILLVEQSLPLALAVGNRFVVLENGHVAFTESGDAVRQDPSRLEKLLTVE